MVHRLFPWGDPSRAWKIVASVAFSAGLEGCSHSPSVVGVWNGTLFQQNVKLEFKEDKSFSLDLKAKTMEADFSGTYTVDAKLLNLDIADYKLKNVPDSVVPLATKMADPLKGTTYHLTYHFNSPDELALSLRQKVDILKRQPSE